jgi:putative oxidoreductase
MNRFHSALLLLGRALFAPLYLVSGYGKLQDPSQTISRIGAIGVPFPVVSYWGAVALELVLILVFVLGLRTRLTAVILLGYTLLTAVLFHGNWDVPGQQINFLKNVAIAGGFLQIIAMGGGDFSVDAWLPALGGRRNKRAESLPS